MEIQRNSSEKLEKTREQDEDEIVREEAVIDAVKKIKLGKARDNIIPKTMKYTI